MKESKGIPIPLYFSNIVDYIRLLAILVSWKFAYSDPEIFAVLYISSYSLDVVDGILARAFNQCTYFGAQLDIFTDRFSSSTLLFVVI
mmetsp:Transcript_36159/g.35111  ORF Transcript_36159/g.35111 Transcript_36159/m.35111 type:complete len:88 (-) Transcript_36159:469-732(-)